MHVKIAHDPKDLATQRSHIHLQVPWIPESLIPNWYVFFYETENQENL